MEFYALTRKSNVVFFGENSMNKSFKVVFNKARGALMVVNEVTSCVQAKGTKTVIAAAVAALAASGAMATEWVKAPEELKTVQEEQKWEVLKEGSSFAFVLDDKAEKKQGAFLAARTEGLTFDKDLWVSVNTSDAQATGISAVKVTATNTGRIFVTSGKDGVSYQNHGMMAENGGTAVNDGLIVAKNAYGMSVETAGPASTLINNNRIVVEETGVGMELGGYSGSKAENHGTIVVGTPKTGEDVDGGSLRFGHGVLIKDTSNNTFTNYGTIEAAEGKTEDGKYATAIEIQKDDAKTVSGNVLNFEAGSKIVGEVHIGTGVTGTVLNANGFKGTVDLNNKSDELTINVKNGADLKLTDGYGSTISEAVIENGKLTASIWQSYEDANGEAASDNIFKKVVVKEDGIFNVKELNSSSEKGKPHDTLLVKNSHWVLSGGDLQVAGQNYTGALKVGTSSETETGSLTINSGDYSFGSLEIGQNGKTTVTGDLTVGSLTLSGATKSDHNSAHVFVTEHGSLTLNGKLSALGNYQAVDGHTGVYVEGNLILGEEADLTDVKKGALTIGGELTAEQSQIFTDDYQLTDLAQNITFVDNKSGLLLTDGLSMTQEEFQTRLDNLENGLQNVDIVFTNVDFQGGLTFDTKLGYNGYRTEVSAGVKPTEAGEVELTATDDDVAVGALKVDAGTTKVSLKNSGKEFVFAGLGGNVITGVDSVDSITAEGEVTLGWDETSKGVVNAENLNVQKLSVAGQFEATNVKVAQDSQVKELGSLKVEQLTGSGIFSVQQGATLDVRHLALNTQLSQGSTLVIGERVADKDTTRADTNLLPQIDETVNIGHTAIAPATKAEVDAIATTNPNGRNLLIAAAGDQYKAETNVGLYVDNTIAVDETKGKLLVGTNATETVGGVSLGDNAVMVIDASKFYGDQGAFDAKLSVTADTTVLLTGADRIGNVKLFEGAGEFASGSETTFGNALQENDKNAWLSYGIEKVTEGENKGTFIKVAFEKQAKASAEVNAFAESVLTNGSESLGVVNAIGTTFVDDQGGLTDLGEEALDEYMALPVVAGTYNAAYDAAEQVWNTVGAHNIDRTPGKSNGVWADVFYSANEAGDMYGSGYGYEADVYGGVLGYDYTASCGGKIGAALTIGTSDADAKGDFIGDYGNDADFWGLSIYASKDITEKMIVSADVTYLSLDNDIKGSIAGASVAESIDSSVISVGLRADWKAYESNAFEVVPHAGIRYAQIDVDDYREMDGESLDVLEMPIGVAFNGKFETAGMKFVPTLDFTIVPQIGDTEVHPLNGDTLDVLNNTYNTTLGISAEYGDFTFGVAAKYGFGTDDRSNAGVKINATYAF